MVYFHQQRRLLTPLEMKFWLISMTRNLSFLYRYDLSFYLQLKISFFFFS